MGLFDAPTPEQVMAEQNRRGMLEDMARANMSPGRGFVASASQAGRSIGNAINGPGAEVQRAQKLQQVQNAVMQSGVQMGTPEFFDLSSRLLQQAGLGREAMEVQMIGREQAEKAEDRGIKNQYMSAQTDAMYAPKERKTIKGADGYNYYADTGERVLPGVKKDATINPSKVKKATIYDNGLVQMVMDDGQVVVERLDEENANLVKRAQDFGAEIQGKRAGERTNATESSKHATKAFEQLNKVNANIKNIDAVIRAIDDGANTGFIQSKLPSVKAASIRLGQIRNQLGLDVVGAVTFGALSEGELNLALSTALPDTLEPKELRKWAIDKKASQEKLASVLEDAAKFLGVPGNSVADYIDYKTQTSIGKQSAPTKQATAPQAAIDYLKKNDSPEMRKQFEAKYGYIPE